MPMIRPGLRDEDAIIVLSALFGGGSNRPDPARIRLANRAEVLWQLKCDASGSLHKPDAEKEAAKLLQAFGAH